MGELDLTSFRSAIAQLGDALGARGREPENVYIRDSVIKRFEFTYELTWKTLKRYLEMTAPNRQEIESMSFPALIRTGGEQELLRSGWDRWEQFRNARNQTSHVYNEGIAMQVAQVAPEFLLEAEHLLAELGRKAV